MNGLQPQISYRALAIGVSIDNHPLQIITRSLHDAADWTEKVMKIHKCPVDIYITEEKLLRREQLPPQKKEKE